MLPPQWGMRVLWSELLPCAALRGQNPHCLPYHLKDHPLVGQDPRLCPIAAPGQRRGLKTGLLLARWALPVVAVQIAITKILLPHKRRLYTPL